MTLLICSNCRGSGIVVAGAVSANGGRYDSAMKCLICNGSGVQSVHDPKRPGLYGLSEMEIKANLEKQAREQIREQIEEKK